MAIIKRFMLFLALLLFGLLLTGCSDSAENSEVDEVLESEITAEDEPEDPEALPEDEDTDKSSGSSSTGASFKHEVKMDIDGVVEKDQGEEWWVMD